MDTKIQKWTKSKEFMDAGKTITPTAFNRICPPDTNKYNPQFLDAEGCTYRLSYVDHDNGDAERWYESNFKSIYWAVKAQKVEKGKKYHAVLQKNNEGHWEWKFSLTP